VDARLRRAVLLQLMQLAPGQAASTPGANLKNQFW
jgi:hypothetical protein